MARQHLHHRPPVVGDLVHPIEYRPFSPLGTREAFKPRTYADTDRVGLVIEKQGLEVLVEFVGEKERLTGAPHRLWYSRTNVITIDGVREIP